MKTNLLSTFPLLLSLSLSCAGPQTEQPTAKTAEPSPEQEKRPIDPRYQTLPQPGPAPAWHPPTADKTRLGNGLTVWYMPSGSTPLVSIHLLLPAGTAEDPKGQEGLTVLAADLLDEGAGKYSALQLSDQLGQLATDYQSSGGVDYVLLSMDTLEENLDASLALLADIARRPRLLPQEFERRKKHYEASALAARDDPHSARSKVLARALFGNGYGGGEPMGTVESLKSIQFAQVARRAKQMTVPDGAHLTFAGAIDEATAMTLSKKHFETWKGTRTSFETDVVPAPDGNTVFLADFPGATQSSLAIAIRSGAEGDPRQIAEDVLFEKIGGSFTGRINMNLREDKGYTYGAFSMFHRFKRAGYLAVVADVKSETTSPSVAEVLSELSAVCGDRPLTIDELKSGVEGMLLGYPLQFDEISSAGYRLAALPLRGRPVDYWTTWPEKVSSISVEQANDAAQPYCDPKKYSVIVAGDAASVGPALEELGMEIVLTDHDGIALSQPDSQ